MGLYDTVIFECPDCGGKVEAQSKVADCALIEYSSDSVPMDIAVDIDGWPANCVDCRKSYKVFSYIPMGNVPMGLR